MPAKKQQSEKKSTRETELGSVVPTQISDVARPDALPAASPTARPVIVTNRLLMQDPMMVSHPPGDQPGLDSSDSGASTAGTKLVIKPLSEQDKAEDDGGPTKLKVRFAGDTDDGDDKDIVEATAIPAGAAQAEVTPPAAVPSKVADDSASQNDSSGSDALPPQKDSTADISKDSAEEAAKLEAEAKAEDELDSLVEQKTYFLPINAVGLRRSRHVYIFGFILILILALAWLDISLDAGFVTIPGIKPLTHLFTN